MYLFCSALPDEITVIEERIHNKAVNPKLEATQQLQHVTPARQKPTGAKANVQNNDEANRIPTSTATETNPTDNKIAQPKACTQKVRTNTNNNLRKMSSELNSNLPKPSFVRSLPSYVTGLASYMNVSTQKANENDANVFNSSDTRATKGSDSERKHDNNFKSKYEAKKSKPPSELARADMPTLIAVTHQASKPPNNAFNNVERLLVNSKIKASAEKSKAPRELSTTEKPPLIAATHQASKPSKNTARRLVNSKIKASAEKSKPRHYSNLEGGITTVMPPISSSQLSKPGTRIYIVNFEK